METTGVWVVVNRHNHIPIAAFSTHEDAYRYVDKLYDFSKANESLFGGGVNVGVQYVPLDSPTYPVLY